ncbi:MAG TPA: GNAT family N-acetyltransferase [Lysobacter sp.]
MRTSPLVRLARTADLTYLHAIERAAATLFPAGRIPDVDDVMPIGDLESAMEDGLLLVATSPHLVVGFAMAQEQDGFLHLAVMAVHPDHGNRGLGRKLVLAMIDEAARRKQRGVTLTTFEDLPWNGPFYRKTGFRVLGDSELGPALRNLLAQEARLGMVNRVAMRYAMAA